MLEKYPLALHTIRACAYCSHHSANGIEEMIHLANHTPEQKKYLQSGDISRLITYVERRLDDFRDRESKRHCCESNTCLHNYKSAMEKRMEIIIKKLKLYEDPNDVRTIIYPRFENQ